MSAIPPGAMPAPGATPGAGYPGPSPQPPVGGGLTQVPGAAPGGVAQGGPPRAALGAMAPMHPPGFGMQPPPSPGSPPLSPVPGMIINPAFQQWKQMQQAWQAENFRRQSQFLSACHVIRRDATTGYKIDIEADSTVAPDELAEKAARTEFLTSIVPLLQIAIPQVSTNPAIAPLIQALVLFGVRAFPAARPLEDNFEQAFAALAQTPPQPPPGAQGRGGAGKSPAEMQTELQIAQGQGQVDMAKIQSDQQKENVQLQIQQQKNAADLYKAMLQMQQTQQKNQADTALRSAEIQQQSQIMDARQQLVQARMANMLSRSATGLV